MTQLEALNRQIAVLNETDSAAAEIELARGLARLLDSGQVGSEFWREYRFALNAVREALDGGDVDRRLEDLVARLGETPIRDEADQ